MTRPDLEQGIVYKVVSHHSGALFSALIEDPSWRVEYTQGKEVKPHNPHSPLFAFRDLETAEQWILRGRKNVWRATAKGIRKPLPNIPWERNIKAFQGFWRNRWLRFPALPIHDNCPPRGTVFCRTITLLEQVS